MREYSTCQNLIEAPQFLFILNSPSTILTPFLSTADIMKPFRCIIGHIHIYTLLQIITVVTSIQPISATSSSTNSPTQSTESITATVLPTSKSTLIPPIDVPLITRPVDATTTSSVASTERTAQPTYANQSAATIESHDSDELLVTPAALRSYEQRGCSLSEFTCINLRCVPLSKYCDRANDCGDNSDEPRFCTRKLNWLLPLHMFGIFLANLKPLPIRLEGVNRNWKRFESRHFTLESLLWNSLSRRVDPI